MSMKRYSPVVILVLTAALMLLAGFLANQREEEVYSLLLPGGDTDRVTEYLRQEGVGGIYSDKMSVVYSDFTSLKEIPLSELSGRLLPADRRYDPYLEELSSLFDTPGGTRVFFQSDKTLVALLVLLAPLRDIADWEQAGSPFLLVLCPLLYAVLIAINIFRYRSVAFWALTVQFLWIPYLLNAEGAHIVFIPLLIYWEISCIGCWGDWKSCAPFGAAALITGIVLTGEGSFLLMGGEIGLTFAAGILLRKIYFPELSRPAMGKGKGKTVIFRKKTEHALFEPTYFAKKTSENFSSSLTLPGSYSLTVLILALPLLFSFNDGLNRGIHLPDAGDLYDHIYYQENILYSPEWGAREPLVVSSFEWDRNTGEIKESREMIALFSSDWIGDVNRRYADGFADSLLLDVSSGKETLSVKFYTDFDKYSIFAIIVLFFLSKLVFSFPGVSGREKKSLQIIKRGREVA